MNLLEYALGLDPHAFSALPAAVVEDDFFSLIYTIDLLAAGVTIVPEWSVDLATWHDDGLTLETLGESGGIRTMKASIPAASAACFLRLKVTTP